MQFEVSASAPQPVSCVLLNSVGLTINSVSVGAVEVCGDKSGQPCSQYVWYDLKRQADGAEEPASTADINLMAISLGNQTLSPGEPQWVSLTYTGKLGAWPTSNEGLLQSAPFVSTADEPLAGLDLNDLQVRLCASAWLWCVCSLFACLLGFACVLDCACLLGCRCICSAAAGGGWQALAVFRQAAGCSSAACCMIWCRSQHAIARPRPVCRRRWVRPYCGAQLACSAHAHNPDFSLACVLAGADCDPGRQAGHAALPALLRLPRSQGKVLRHCQGEFSSASFPFSPGAGAGLGKLGHHLFNAPSCSA